jgi:glycosyltransferase involved in cell wall biosynthesis
MAAAVSRRSRSWDAAVSHWLLPSGLVTALTARKPHVAVAHSADVWLLGRIPTGPAIVRAVAERSTAVVAVCPQIAEQLDALGAATAARRTAVVPFGPATMPAADAKAATELRRLVGSPRLVVAAIARLVPVKGLDVLLGALARPECAGVGALIAGAGPDGPRLEKLALRSGARARFLGEVSQQGRAELLSAADALVVPSVRLPSGRTEGVPVAALEGLAAGLPVIASSVGGLPWAVGDAGILVEPGSEAALARAMSALERRPDLRAQAARRAKERARDFGWQAAARRLEHLLLEDAHGPLAR